MVKNWTVAGERMMSVGLNEFNLLNTLYAFARLPSRPSCEGCCLELGSKRGGRVTPIDKSRIPEPWTMVLLLIMVGKNNRLVSS